MGSATSARRRRGAGEFDLRDAPPTVLHNLDTPTICALNGGAAGYGLDLALGCDIRIATASAKLAPGFAKRGILPESGGTWLLPRMIGYAKAAEIAFRGRTLTAAEALELGIVNHVVPDDEFARVHGRGGRRDRRQRAARRAGDQAHDARRRDRDVRAERPPRVPAAAAAARHERLQRGRRRVHGEAAGRVHRSMTAGDEPRIGLLEGLATTRAIRRYTADPIPDADLAEILWHAARAPSGTNRQPFRFLVLRRDDPEAAPARRLLAESFREAGSPSGPTSTGTARRRRARARARMQAAMQHYVDHIDRCPVDRARRPRALPPAEPGRGCVGVPGVPEPAAGRPRPRLRRRDDRLAPRRRGRAARAARASPTASRCAACITLGVPAGRHGPLRRKPLGGLVHDGRWGRPATWLGERGE